MSNRRSKDVNTVLAAGREYLAGLLECLESFYERTQPLSSLSKVCNCHVATCCTARVQHSLARSASLVRVF